MLRRSSPSTAATLTGGDLSVDVLHTEDSVTLGDETNKLVFTDVSATKCIPVDVRQLPAGGATSANQTNGTQLTQLTDAASNIGEFDDVGGEKALKVSVIASVGGGGGGTAATDSAAYTATSSQFTPVGGAYDDTSSDALAEGEMGMVRLTSARAMHVAVQNSVAVTGTFYQATQPVSAASLPLPSGAATSANQDTANTALAAIKTAVETIDNAISGTEMQVDVLTMPTVAVTGTFWQATQPVSGTFWQATQPVSIASMPTTPVSDNGGSLTVDGTVGISGSVAVTGTFWQATQPVSGTVTASNVTGNVAHDSADSGNPVKIGGVARNADPTNVANGDRVDAYFDLNGKQVVTPHAPRNLVAHNTGTQSSTTEATILSAGGAGVYHDVTKLIFTNSNTTDAAQVQIRDATAGTIRFEMMIPPNSGMVADFGDVPMCQTTANNNWTIDLAGAVSTVYWYVQAVKRTA